MSINGTSQISVVTPPTVEPITVAQAKDHLRVSVSTQDTYIGTLVQMAREWMERFLGRSIIVQTRKLAIPRFCESVYLPYGRVTSVSSIKYLDEAGVEQTLAASNYDLITSDGAAYVNRGWNVTWPTTRYVDNAVRITYVAGYPGTGSPVDLRGGVPEMVKLGMKMLIQAAYDDLKAEDRKAVEDAVKQIVWPERLVSF